MVAGYIIIVIGGLIGSLGLPSRTGRRGSLGPKLLIAGLIIATVGILIIFAQSGWLAGLMSIAVAYCLPSLLSMLRR